MLDTVLPYYTTPSVVILPSGVVVMADQAAVRSVVDFRIGQLRADNYARSELLDRETTLLAPTLATISGTLCDFSSAGVEFGRNGVTYTLRLDDGAWRVCAVTSYDPPSER